MLGRAARRSRSRFTGARSFPPHRRALSAQAELPQQADVVVVGGGFAGCARPAAGREMQAEHEAGGASALEETAAVEARRRRVFGRANKLGMREVHGGPQAESCSAARWIAARMR